MPGPLYFIRRGKRRLRLVQTSAGFGFCGNDAKSGIKGAKPLPGQALVASQENSALWVFLDLTPTLEMLGVGSPLGWLRGPDPRPESGHL